MSGQIEINGRIVTVREMSVAEVRAWAIEIDAGTRALDALDELMHPDCSLADIKLMTDASDADIDACTAADLDRLVEEARKWNPHFFRVRGALTQASRIVRAASPLESTAAPSHS